MAVSVADIQAMPGLSTVTSADAQFWIDMAADFVSEDYWPDTARWDQATKLWVANALVVQGGTGSGMAAAGPLKDRKVGDVSAGHAVPTPEPGSDVWLSMSQWGQLYKRMVRRYMGNLTLAV